MTAETTRRIAIAEALGFADAKLLVRVFETLGFPLEDCAIWAAEKDLRLDLSGLRHELMMLGMQQRSVDLYVTRMKDAWELRHKEVFEQNYAR